MEKSWGELVNNRLKERTELGWDSNAQPKVQYVTRYQVSRQERAFDPVLQAYRDSKVDETHRTTEMSKKVSRMNQTQTRELSNRGYDTLTHEPLAPWIATRDAQKRKTGTANLKPGYNIISNEDLADHHPAHPSMRPPRMKPEEKQVKSVAPAREVNIITNRYVSAHEQKTQIDRKCEQNAATNTFWSKRDFNPITVSYYDNDKERTFQEENRRRQAEHGKNLLRKLPLSVQKSEDIKHNIITNQPRGDTMQKNEKSATAPRESLYTTTQRFQKERQIKSLELEETRVRNRCLPERHMQQHGYTHGFNIVDTRSFDGRNAAPKAKVRQGNKTLWDKLDKGGRD